MSLFDENNEYEKIFDKFPVINLDRITLREMVSSDNERFFQYMTNPKVTKYLNKDDSPSYEYWANLFKRKSSIYWAIALQENDLIVGTCGFNLWDRKNKIVDISYDLSPDYWRQGITTQALQAIINFAFTKMGVTIIKASVMEKNQPSIDLLKKLNFQNYNFNISNITSTPTSSNEILNFFLTKK